MTAISLRTLVSVVGILLAVVTAIAVPSGVLLDRHADVAETVAFKARLNADRLARYISADDGGWRSEPARLAERIRLPSADEAIIHQKIYDEAGSLLLEHGAPPPAPAISRRSPIIAGAITRGYVEVTASLRETLYWTALAAMVSTLLAFGMYFAMRTLPLRVLHRTLSALSDSERSLSAQRDRMDIALANMSQGLCMFDADEKLVIVNQRFAEIYGLPPDEIKPGMTRSEVLGLASGEGKLAEAAVEGPHPLPQSLMKEGKAWFVVERLTDGRSIDVSHRSTPDGGFVVTFEDITERLLVQERIKHLVHCDALTNLLNRASFYERMEKELARLRHPETIAVFSLDIDNFKGINDTLGQPIGDQLLQAVAERIKSCVHSDDVVARLGDDEFAVVQVPAVVPSNACALAKRLIESIGTPYDIDGQQVVVGVSIGIAIAPVDNNMPDGLMKNADLALARAKADGGGSYRFFKFEMDARMQARRALELDLRKAIVNGEFELFYQPVVDIQTRQITGCEALVRWHHPEHGIISPLEFIPIAEETGLIVPIGEWVLRRAFADAAGWPPDMMVAVNVSPAQFKSGNLVPTVVNALATSGLAATRLELEITELVLMQENEGAIAVLNQFHDLGIRIAMDDFGTGYSSLVYLRSFPFDKIKIDQSFIRDLSHKEDSVAIIRAVVGLSSSLGIRTTAEGVETEAQLARLKAEGCNEAQGFLFSEPRSAAEVARMLSDQQRPCAEVVA